MKEVDLLLTNATVVTMDETFSVHAGGAVAVHQDEIVAVGTKADLDLKANEVFDCGGKVLMPGLINAHTHVPMTLLRGLADDRRLDVWLMGYVMPVEREFVTPEFCRLGTLMACAEMIRGGTTSFADMYYFEEAVAQATADVGMRALCSQTVLKFPAPDADSYDDSLALARDFIAKWRGHSLIVPSIAPHAPYTITTEILQTCRDIAVEFDVPLHIHIAETRQEVDDWRETYDMPVIPWVKKQGLFEAKVLAAHCVHLDDGEIKTLEHYPDIGVAHNPSSNLKLASGFAPVPEMLESGIKVGVGTDGPSSNNDLDMFEEMRLATFIAKAVQNDPTAMPARTALEMATRMGAEAIHLGHLTGSIEPGKRADLILLDLEAIHNYPHFNHDSNAVYSRIVYAGKSTDVTDVMVNGKWLMRERELLTINEADLMSQAKVIAQNIDVFLIEREDSVLSKLIAIGGAEQEESFEVQVKVQLDSADEVVSAINSGDLTIERTAHYIEYDVYFEFDEPDQGRLRYREDEFVDDKGEINRVRYRLTLTGLAAEREYEGSVFLSRSRFIAPATYSIRFYREYFKPKSEIVIHKDRLRWLINFEDQEFFVNVDKVSQPDLPGYFLEIKSRTWSRKDAESKASLILSLLERLGVGSDAVIREEYPELAPV
jgi:5-methylthioadenosine/S-adenosylhomocysteine deaminase